MLCLTKWEKSRLFPGIGRRWGPGKQERFEGFGRENKGSPRLAGHRRPRPCSHAPCTEQRGGWQPFPSRSSREWGGRCTGPRCFHQIEDYLTVQAVAWAPLVLTKLLSSPPGSDDSPAQPASLPFPTPSLCQYLLPWRAWLALPETPHLPLPKFHTSECSFKRRWKEILLILISSSGIKTK